ncbi:hypothetical protein QKT49_gp255 [Acanthamoeba castellanii medusavirus]|uniref:Uncharacterized protein n=1 Tax=Acanthamoeba castellanii medusavirus J1 TaxID=3114988 RepID=A0A3T1CXF2_9VIRU|nr:hypothetical protein QKT49_gp255 [Acanthamoeba castellanii medusavirus]BBI30508.1 hypothetical protein [Acanthamoeba castellanii medusavirus J1]
MQNTTTNTPLLDAILDGEGWDEEIKRAFYALCVGRLMTKAGEHDEWPVAPIIHGEDNTGAALIARCVIPHLAPSVYKVPRPGDGSVNMSEAFDSDLVLVRTGIHGAPTFSKEEMLAMIHGETVVISRRHALPLESKWTTRVVMVGHSLPSWFHQRQGRDVLLFYFSKALKTQEIDLESEMPAIFEKGRQCYLQLVKKVGSEGDVRAALSPYLY